MVLKSLKSCVLMCEAPDMYFHHIRKGDNVKIYMQTMDLEYSKKVFLSLKNFNSPRCKLLRNCI